MPGSLTSPQQPSYGALPGQPGSPTYNPNAALPPMPGTSTGPSTQPAGLAAQAAEAESLAAALNPACAGRRVIDCRCKLRADELKRHVKRLAEAKEIANRVCGLDRRVLLTVRFGASIPWTALRIMSPNNNVGNEIC